MLWRVFLHDLRFGARLFAKTPGSTLLAMLALALGIGASTAIFSVIRAVLLDPFPYANEERLMGVSITDSRNNQNRTYYSPEEFLAFKEQNTVFEDAIASTRMDVLLTGEGEPEWLLGTAVTTNTFAFLGVPPLFGRALTPEDGKPDAPPAVVIAWKFWQRRFAGSPQVVGQALRLDDRTYTIVGVMPQRFTWRGADVWLPVMLRRGESDPRLRFYYLLGRLKPGISEQAAAAELHVIAQRLAQEFPDRYPKNFKTSLLSLIDWVVGQFRSTLYTVLAAVGLLLLIACGNVANLLLVRATAREKEIAIRTALGASRARLISQMLSESLLLALGGCLLGILFAFAGLRALIALIPPFTIPDEALIEINIPVLLFTLAVSLLTAFLFGLAPVFHALKLNLNQSLQDAGKGADGGARHGRLRDLLVVTEVALALVLLVGAGLLIRSFVALQQMPLGFDPEQLLSMRVPLSDKRYPRLEPRSRFFLNIIERVKALPGVQYAAVNNSHPPFGMLSSPFALGGSPPVEGVRAQVQLCSADYFSVLRVRLLRGRQFTEQEVEQERKFAVINDLMASKYFQNEDPLGKTIRLSDLSTAPPNAAPMNDPSFQIIGVVSNTINAGLQRETWPEVYVPFTLTGSGNKRIFVRAESDPLALTKALREQVWAIDKDQPIADIRTMRRYLDDYTYAQPRFSYILLSVFASAGLLLASIGIYGVVSYNVSRQTREIGIRMALGAKTGDVMKLVLMTGLKLAAVGIIVGSLASLVLTRLIKSQLWGVANTDPLVLGGVALILALTVLLACLTPARRAAKTDPMAALRRE